MGNNSKRDEIVEGITYIIGWAVLFNVAMYIIESNDLNTWYWNVLVGACLGITLVLIRFIVRKVLKKV